MSQNYPNPFNPSTRINYILSESSRVSLIVYDVVGREIATLTDNVQPAGVYTVEWDSKHNARNAISSGVYFARLRVLDEMGGLKFTRTIRLVLLM
jgi:hypothetical protein